MSETKRRQTTPDEFASLSPFARGYAVYMAGARSDEPHIPDESNPYPKGSHDWKEWNYGAFYASISAQEGDDQ